jgi:hypothetical protein
MTWLGAGLVFVAVAVTGLAYLAWYLTWEQRQTRGMAYYGRSLDGRNALKRRIRLLSLPAKPLVHLLAAGSRRRSTMPSFDFEGVSGPPRVSSPDMFARAKAYEPRREDVFVATQMRCGTTWMQQIVFEIASRGRGDLSDSGYGHLYAVSPWIDAINSVSMEAAPLVGDMRARIIKCHLPVSICPYSEAARYIYVTRHPVSCFASILDYNRSLLGPLAPPVATMADWFCSDRMYWRPWPDHVAGWWDWAAARPNVLFLHFEDMKADLGGIVDRVATFLGQSLTAEERARVVEKSSFAWMQAHEDWLEMAPPTMFSVSGGRFLASGRAARHEDVPSDVRQRVLAYCATSLQDRAYPVQRFYPDIR